MMFPAELKGQKNARDPMTTKNVFPMGQCLGEMASYQTDLLWIQPSIPLFPSLISWKMPHAGALGVSALGLSSRAGGLTTVYRDHWLCWNWNLPVH